MRGESRVFMIRILLFICYLWIGAAIFMTLERENNGGKTTDGKEILRLLQINATQRFKMKEEDFLAMIFNISSMTALSSQRNNWDVFKGLTFATHLLTTIGYGNLTPKTPGGQLFTIFYALVGIPLTLLTLKSMGNHYNHYIKKLIILIETRCLKRTEVKGLEGKCRRFCCCQRGTVPRGEKDFEASQDELSGYWERVKHVASQTDDAVSIDSKL
ncbi:potassium channel subfamily K member 16 isoform X2 [Nematostella vectensis]|uniref:potassium channel subfamily K member 16 isoform X2 n=1 Tax=Nematostella vectensis TaxID=45351 RepID=UPI0020772466|nr:potassium channel subfamily K member 16 isoform X2 [Nematostella vectensis]